MFNLKIIQLEERIVLDAAAVAAVIPAATIFVDANSTAAAPDGTSWANAYQSLQDALVKANTVAGPDVIWVAQGIYRPTTTQIEPVSGSPSFIVLGTTSIYGGFVGGTSANANTRDPSLYVTQLDGNIGDPNLLSDNAVHVVTIGSVTATLNITAILDGLTVENGYADGLGGSFNNGRGGGIYSRNNLSLTLNDVIVANNQARIDFTSPSPLIQSNEGLGGGLYMAGIGTLSITNSLFKDNIADQQGAGVMALSAAGSNFVTMNIDDTEFVSNHSVLPYTFINGTFRVGRGGAVYMQGGLNTLHDSLFLNNTAAQGGGAIYNATFAGFANNNTLIEDCRFIGNTSDSWQGGAINTVARFNASTMTINHSLFEGNSSERGGAVGIDFMAVTINDSKFVNNTQKAGGAVFMSNIGALSAGTGPVTSTIHNSDFVNNQATGAPMSDYQMHDWDLAGQLPPINYPIVGGGAIGAWWGGQIDIFDSSFINNVAPNGGAITVASIPIWVNAAAPYDYPSPLDVNGNPVVFTLQTTVGSGGIVNVYGSKFTNNRATNGDGGAILAKPWTFPADPNYPAFPFNLTAPVSVSITNSTFTNNRATGNGGAVALDHANAPVISGNLFVNNTTGLLGDSVYALQSQVNGFTTEMDIFNWLTSQNTFKKLDSYDLKIIA